MLINSICIGLFSHSKRVLTVNDPIHPVQLRCILYFSIQHEVINCYMAQLHVMNPTPIPQANGYCNAFLKLYSET